MPTNTLPSFPVLPKPRHLTAMRLLLLLLGIAFLAIIILFVVVQMGASAVPLDFTAVT